MKFVKRLLPWVKTKAEACKCREAEKLENYSHSRLDRMASQATKETESRVEP